MARRRPAQSIGANLVNRQQVIVREAVIRRAGNGTADIQTGDGTIHRGMPLAGGAVIGAKVLAQFVDGKPIGLAGGATSGASASLVVMQGAGGADVGLTAPSPHALNGPHHDGTLDDDQAPQFLLSNGARSLTGNLPVATDVTIDGVDISAFKAAFDLVEASAGLAAVLHKVILWDAVTKTRTLYDTIVAAITAASSGQFVIVGPGTYAETITLKSGVVVCELIEGTVSVNVVNGVGTIQCRVIGEIELGTGHDVTVYAQRVGTGVYLFPVYVADSAVLRLFGAEIDWTVGFGIGVYTINGGKAYLYQCRCNGKVSGYDLYNNNDAGAAIYVYGCQYDTAKVSAITLLPGDRPLSANPTASAGLTAVNGTAVTFMRSDGAPAISQAIAPTWTAEHLHNERVRSKKAIVADTVLTAGEIDPALLGSSVVLLDVDPALITGLSAGDAISSAPDGSGNSGTISGSGSNRPTYQVVSGVPVIRFAASSQQFLSVADSAVLRPTKVTIIAVYKPTASNQQYSYLLARHYYSGVTWSEPYVSYALTSDNTGGRIPAMEVNNTARRSAQSTIAVTSGAINIVEAMYNASTARVWVNGVLAVTTSGLSGNIGYSATGVLYEIGRAPGAYHIDCDLYRMFVLTDLTDAQLAGVRLYLARKYGAVLATSGDVGYSGNLRPARGDLLATAYAYVPLATPLTSTSWDGDSFSTTAKTVIDLSAVFGAPGGIKAVVVDVEVNDSGSASSDSYLLLGPNNTAGAGVGIPALTVNDRKNRTQVIVPCDANGDIYYQIVASGAATFDVNMRITGYYL